METEEAQTTLRQAQGERLGATPIPPFVLSLSKHERRSYPQRILVIDDEAPVRDMMRQTLERAGYEVIEAGDGRQGMARLRQQPADLVITDILMPEQEGIKTIRMLRKEFPEVEKKATWKSCLSLGRLVPTARSPNRLSGRTCWTRSVRWCRNSLSRLGEG